MAEMRIKNKKATKLRHPEMASNGDALDIPTYFNTADSPYLYLPVAAPLSLSCCWTNSPVPFLRIVTYPFPRLVLSR